MELHKARPEEVVFLDFEGYDFDQPVVLKPVVPDRDLWKRVFSIALDDLSELIAPGMVIFCEGKPRHEETADRPTFDAEVLDQIFSQKYPDTSFVPLGGTNDLERNALLVGGILDHLFSGIKVGRLSDRDDRTGEDIQKANEEGYSVLHQRDIENYLWSDEILATLCEDQGKPECSDEVLQQKNVYLTELENRGKPRDDVKAITGQLYSYLKRELSLTQCGNNSESFAKTMLVPLITPETTTFQQLDEEIFGPLAS